MRIFGTLLHAIRISRLASCSSKQRSYYSSVLSSFPNSPCLNSIQLLKSCTTFRSFGSKSGNSKLINRKMGRSSRRLYDKSKSSESSVTKSRASVPSSSDILPVALINHNSHNVSSLKILLIPVNLFEGGDEAMEKSFSRLSIIRDNANQIEVFNEKLPKFTFSKPTIETLTTNNDNNANCKDNDIDDKSTQNPFSDKVIPKKLKESEEFSLLSKMVSPDQQVNDSVALYKGLNEAFVDRDVNYTYDSFDWDTLNRSKDNHNASISPTIEERLIKLAMYSLRLKVDMINAKDDLAIASLSSGNSRKNTTCEPQNISSLKDLESALTLCLDPIPTTSARKVSLKFNALIQGIVEIDTSKITPDQLKEIKVPELSDYVTALAANICSTAIPKGFPAELSRKSFSTKSGVTSNDSKKRSPHIICVREGDKGCTSPGLADNAKFVASGSSSSSSGSSGSQKSTSKQKQSESCAENGDSSANVGDCGKRGLMSCKAYARALEEAEKRRAALKNDDKGSKTDSCKPCSPVSKATSESQTKCASETGDPCKKKTTNKTPDQKKPDPSKSEKKKPKIECAGAKKTDSEKKPKVQGVAAKKTDSCKDEIAKMNQKNFPDECNIREKTFACRKPSPAGEMKDPCKPADAKDSCKDPCKSEKKASKSNDSCKTAQSKKDPCKAEQKKDSCKSEKKASKSNDPCKPAQSKADPCKAEQKKDTCKSAQSKSEKKDLCKPQKSKSSDSCKSGKTKADPCKAEQKKDTCKSAQSKSEKKDPCKPQKSKSSDSCKSGKTKADPCKAEQKKDTCKSAQSKSEKKDPCKPQKSKSSDSCKSGKTKADPCKAEQKKDTCKSAQSKSEKKDPCKPQKSKSSDSCKSGKTKAEPCKAEQKKDTCKSSQSKSEKKDLCKPQKSKSSGSCKSGKTKADPCKAEQKKDTCKSSQTGKIDSCKAKEKDDRCKDPCKSAKSKSSEKNPCQAEKSDPCKPEKKSSGCKSEEKKDTCKSTEKKDPSKCSSKKSKSKTSLRTKPAPKSGSVSASKACPTSSSASKLKESESSKSKSSCTANKSTDKKKATGPCADSKAKDTKSSASSAKTSEGKHKSSLNKEKSTVCPSAGEMKSTKPNCPGNKSNKDPGKKCFSTTSFATTHNSIIKRSFSTNTFTVLKKCIGSVSSGYSRFFSSKKDKDEKKGASPKCTKNTPKTPKKRFTIRRADTVKDPGVCYSESTDQCGGSQLCDPKKAQVKDKRCPKVRICTQKPPEAKDDACKDHKKENKNLYKRKLIPKTKSRNVTPYSNMPIRNFRTSAHKTFQEDTQNNEECDLNECGQQEEKELTNEVIKVVDASQIEIFSEVVPRFSDYDVLVRTDCVAISGSDLHVYETGGKVLPGITLGHDASGIVEKVGKCVQIIRPGDRVAIESGLSCGICDYCKHGAYNICSHLLHNGFFGKFQVHPGDLCHKLPDSVSTEDGCLTQILATGCHACSKARIKPTSNVLIIGSSPTAIAAAVCVRAIGANRICFLCTQENDLEFIRTQFNFDYVSYNSEMEIIEVVECIYCFLREWPDVVINCAVNEVTLNITVMSLAPSGMCVMAECESECASFNVMETLMKNLKLIPSFRSTNMFPTALLLMDSGQATMRELIVETYPWDQAQSAFVSALHHSNESNRKVVVKCGDENDKDDDL